jgi:hypothetical protein
MTLQHLRDVVIKAVAAVKKVRMSRFLNSALLRPDSSAHRFQNWQCAVMPLYDGCDISPFLSGFQFLDFAEQVLEVSHAHNSQSVTQPICHPHVGHFSRK